MGNFFKKLKKPTLIILAIALSLVLLSQTTEGKRLNLPAGIFEAVRNFLVGNPNLSAADYKDGTIILIKPMATGVGEGRYEAGDIVEIRGGEEMYKRFGNGDFLGSSEKTNLLPVYYPGKLTEEQKKELLAPEYETDRNLSRQAGRNLKTERNKMILRRKVGIDYTKFLNTDEVLKVRSFEKLDRLPEIDLSPIIKKSSEQKSVVQIPRHLAEIESASWRIRNSVKKIIRKIIPLVYAGTGGTKTICTSGCDYTTLNLWEAGEQGILTEPAIAQITGGFQDTTAVTIDGWTTSAANYISIYTTSAARHNGKWNTGNYILNPSDDTIAIFVYVSNVKIDGLQFNLTVGNSNHGVETGASAGNIYISDSIFKSSINYSAGINHGQATTIYVYNNLFYDFTGTNSLGILIADVMGINAYIYNNTFYNILNAINLSSTDSRATVKNNLYQSGGFSGADGFAGYAAGYINSDYNLSNIAGDTTGGAHDKDNTTVAFVDAANDDFHLRIGDSAARNYGVRDPGSGLFSDDIDGQSRPETGAWDIGADEVAHTTTINTPLSGRFKDSSLVGYWSFDGANMGTTSATDLSGNSNTGWLMNGVKKVSGINGQALSFDGADDYVGLSNIYSNTSSFTISVWANNTGTTNQMSKNRIFMNGRGGDIGWGVGFGDAEGSIRFTKAGIADLDINLGSWPSGWTHYAWVVGSDNDIELFVNGVSRGKYGNTTAINTNLAIAAIGVDYSGLEEYINFWQGQIDETRIYNRALSAGEIAEQYRAGAARIKVNSPPSAPFGNSGLVGYWSFNGADTTWTSTTAGTTNDLSGNGNTGTMTNMSRSTSPVPGKIGQALNFDGVNDYVETGTMPFLSSISISAWIKSPAAPTSGSNTQVLNYRERNFKIQWNSTAGSEGTLGVVSGGGYNSASFGTIQPNTWYHIVGVYDGSNIYAYNNGALVGSPIASGAPDNEAVGLEIGQGIGGESQYFTGQIDEVRIYNRALSVDEIGQLYRAGARKTQFASKAASYTLKDSHETDNDSWEVGNLTAKTYLGTSFIAGSSYTLTRVIVKMAKVVSPTGTLTLYVYSDSAGMPNGVLATSNGTVSMSGLPTTADWVAQWEFSGLNLTSATMYHLVVKSSTVDATNYVVGRAESALSGQIITNDADGVAPFTVTDSTSQLDFRTYTSP